MELEKILSKYIDSEFAQEKEKISFEIINDHRRIASRIVEVEISFENAKTMTVFVKKLSGNKKSKSFVKNQKLIQNEFEVLKKTYRSTSELNHISVVKPLAVFPENLALITLSAGHENALNVFKKSIGWLARASKLSRATDISAKCGKFLLMLQSMNIDRNEAIDKDSVSRDLLHSIEGIPLEAKLYKKMHVALHDFVKNQLCELDSNIIVSRYHGDFTPQNVIVRGENIFVLDFCDSGMGSIYTDIARFYQILDNYVQDPRFSFKKINILKAAFLENFDSIDLILFTVFRLEVLIQGIKERVRLRKDLIENERSVWLLNEWYIRKRIKKLCLVCQGKA